MAPKMFEAAEIRSLLEAAPTQLRAMILLGINCGFGNNDCGTLPKSDARPGGRLDQFPKAEDRHLLDVAPCGPRL